MANLRISQYIPEDRIRIRIQQPRIDVGAIFRYIYDQHGYESSLDFSV